jgi:Recombinase
VYGYCNQRDGVGYARRVIDEGEAVIVRRIFTLYAEGDGLARIAKRLNRDSVEDRQHQRPLAAGTLVDSDADRPTAQLPHQRWFSTTVALDG